MEDVEEKLGRIKEAVNKIFSSLPSVPGWCRMCRTLADYVFVATQHGDRAMHSTDVFRKAIGYLTLPPKRVPKEKVLDDEEWMRIHSYSESEQRDMGSSMNVLELRLVEWASAMHGDEDAMYLGPAHVPFAQFIWTLRQDFFKGRFSVFKNPLGTANYCSSLFLAIGGQMKKKPIFPEENVEYRKTFGVEDEYRKRMLGYHERIATGVERMVSDAASDGQARRRMGSDGEITQENEILRRVRANGDRGLRGFVAQILRETNWQFRDGHPNTEEGRRRCYNRVYALMHPFRRRVRHSPGRKLAH